MTPLERVNRLREHVPEGQISHQQWAAVLDLVEAVVHDADLRWESERVVSMKGPLKAALDVLDQLDGGSNQ